MNIVVIRNAYVDCRLVNHRSAPKLIHVCLEGHKLSDYASVPNAIMLRSAVSHHRFFHSSALASAALLTGCLVSVDFEKASSENVTTVPATTAANSTSSTPDLNDPELIRSLSPIAPFRILNPNPNLEICFDTRTRNAVYVQHRVVPNDATSTSMRRPRFYEDKSIEEVYRSKDSLYISSGYDRGHLAPAADFVADGKQFDDTFNLCNVSPQDPEMNRKIWARLEVWTRNVAERAWRERNHAVTYAITGPLWLPRVKVDKKTFLYNVKGIGAPPMLVHIPTHFYKVVVVVDRSHTRILEFACFVMPNDAAANERMIQDYIVSWSDLETVTGLRFFPHLADNAFLSAANALSLRLNPMLDPTDQSMKLLTDGKSCAKTGGWSARQQAASSAPNHLCANNSCKIPSLSSKRA
jgi:endonuclease G, mitochondrial